MRITKKAFIEAMAKYPTIFLGVTKRLYSEDEVFCCIRDMFNTDEFYNLRTCTARSNSLIFSDDCRLYFDTFGKYTYGFEKYDYEDGEVYIYCYTWIDEFDNKLYTKAMYYLARYADYTF